MQRAYFIAFPDGTTILSSNLSVPEKRDDSILGWLVQNDGWSIESSVEMTKENAEDNTPLLPQSATLFVLVKVS